MPPALREENHWGAIKTGKEVRSGILNEEKVKGSHRGCSPFILSGHIKGTLLNDERLRGVSWSVKDILFQGLTSDE